MNMCLDGVLYHWQYRVWELSRTKQLLKLLDKLNDNCASMFRPSHFPRKCLTKIVSLWSGFMNWAITPTHPATTPQSNRCPPEAAAASGEPAPSANGTFPLMAKAGHGGVLKPGARTKPHFFCPGCWATRTTRW